MKTPKKLISVKFPITLIEDLKKLKAEGYNVSELIRQAVINKVRKINKAS